jgi:two-component system response regulator RegA
VRHVLLADDDQAFRHCFETATKPLGWHLIWARTREEALHRLRHDAVQAIVMDPGMPTCLWYSFIADVVMVAHTRPVHIVTAYASSALRRRAADFGVSSHLVKPALMEQVIAALEGKRYLWSLLEAAETLASIEWEHINNLIYDCEGSVTLAAQRLGIPRQTVYRKIRKHSPLRASVTDDQMSLVTMTEPFDTTPPPRY